MFAFIMKKRVINILNKNKQRRTFKFLPEYEGGVVVYAEDPIKSVKYDKKEKSRIVELEYNDGPVLSIGNSITFKERGKYRIIDIFNYVYNDSECHILDMLKIE